MRRRNFIMAGLGVTALPGIAKGQDNQTRTFYEVTIFESQIGEPFARLESWTEKTLLPAIQKLDVRNVGCFTLALGVETPQLMMIIEHSSWQQMHSRWSRLVQTAEWKEGLTELEKGTLPPYDRIEKRWLRATPYSPPLSEAVGKSKDPRFFEFRLYHSPTFRQLRALHERFSGPEIKIFHRVGIHPILYADTVFGPQMPCLTYMTPFETLADRETAWNKFRADPEWIKVRADSVARAGEIVTHTDRLILQATQYSPIK